MTVQAFSHFGICVTDPERSMEFYCDMLGFEPVSKLNVADGNSSKLVELSPLDLHSYFLERDGVRIELLHFVSPGHEEKPVPRPMNRLGLTHFALRVQQLDALLDRLRGADFEVMDKTAVGGPGGSTSAVFALDPDGLRVELLELPGDPREPLGRPFERSAD